MVVVEPEREAHPLDRFFARCLDDKDAVRPLSRSGDLESALDLVHRPEDATGDDAGRVTAVAGREAERVGAARSERGLDQVKLSASSTMN